MAIKNIVLLFWTRDFSKNINAYYFFIGEKVSPKTTKSDLIKKVQFRIKDSKHNNFSTAKICANICLWALLVPQTSQIFPKP